MRVVVFLLLACSLRLGARAEPFYPFLSKPAVDSLRARLWQTPPSTARVRLLLRLSAVVINQYPISYLPVDSAYIYSQQALELSKKLQYAAGQTESACIMAYYLANANQAEEARKLIGQAMARSRQQHSLALEALCWRYLTHTADQSPAGENQKYRYFAQALRCYRLINSRLWEIYTRKQMADVHLRQGQQALARAELLQVVRLYRANGYRRLHYTFDLLAVTNAGLANYKDGLQYSLASIRVARETRDTTLLSLFYHRTASIYQELNQRQKALDYDQLALRSAHQATFPPLYCLESALSIARNLIALGQPQQALAQLLQERQDFPARDADTRMAEAEGLTTCYLALGQYALAARYSQPLHELLTRKSITANYRQRARICSLLSMLYVAEAHYSKARPYLTQALAFYKLLGNRADMASTCLLLFKVDSAQGRYPAAIAHYQRYKALNDTIFNEKTSKQVAGLQIQYDTEKKEQNIALLTRQNQAQQAGLRQREWQRNATLGGAVLLTLLLGVSYNRARLKQRSTRLLEEKQREINQKNQALEQVLSEKDELLTEKEGLLVEKEWMLKEIHHRVKNNLQIVSELLESQTDQLQEPRTLAIIRESQNRVQAMALVHQKLYQSHNLARVDMPEYIREIVEHLLASFHCEAVQEQLDIAPVELDVALATPLGLIINEAVTNSLKYAFPDGRPGTIRIGLAQLPSQRYQLTLADDGVGLPAGFDIEASRSMGLTLIKGLSEQIDADLTFPPARGVCICLEFEGRKAGYTDGHST